MTTTDISDDMRDDVAQAIDPERDTVKGTISVDKSLPLDEQQRTKLATALIQLRAASMGHSSRELDTDDSNGVPRWWKEFYGEERKKDINWPLMGPNGEAVSVDYYFCTVFQQVNAWVAKHAQSVFGQEKPLTVKPGKTGDEKRAKAVEGYFNHLLKQTGPDCFADQYMAAVIRCAIEGVASVQVAYRKDEGQDTPYLCFEPVAINRFHLSPPDADSIKRARYCFVGYDIPTMDLVDEKKRAKHYDLLTDEDLRKLTTGGSEKDVAGVDPFDTVGVDVPAFDAYGWVPFEGGRKYCRIVVLPEQTTVAACVESVTRGRAPFGAIHPYPAESRYIGHRLPLLMESAKHARNRLVNQMLNQAAVNQANATTLITGEQENAVTGLGGQVFLKDPDKVRFMPQANNFEAMNLIQWLDNELPVSKNETGQYADPATTATQTRATMGHVEVLFEMSKDTVQKAWTYLFDLAAELIFREHPTDTIEYVTAITDGEAHEARQEAMGEAEQATEAANVLGLGKDIEDHIQARAKKKDPGAVRTRKVKRADFDAGLTYEMTGGPSTMDKTVKAATALNVVNTMTGPFGALYQGHPDRLWELAEYFLVENEVDHPERRLPPKPDPDEGTQAQLTPDEIAAFRAALQQQQAAQQTQMGSGMPPQPVGMGGMDPAAMNGGAVDPMAAMNGV